MRQITPRRAMSRGGPAREDAEAWVIGVAGDGAGIAAAAIHATGSRVLALGPAAWRAWTAEEAAALAGPSGGAREMLETAAATMIAALPLDRVADLLVIEMPAPGAAPAILAEVTGLPVAHDLRAADLRLGGAGHPLEPVFHHALAGYLGASCLTLLDLGARVAVLSQARPEAGGTPQDDGALCAFDAGPGLGMLDTLPRGGRKRQGKVRAALLRGMLGAPHLARMPPKALGPEDFSGLAETLGGLHPADAAATLRALVVEAVALGMAHLPAAPDRLIVTGAGRRDAGTMTRLSRALPCPVLRAEDAGLDGDAIGAQALAFTGLRATLGLPTTFPSTTGVAAAVGGAEVTMPGGLGATAPGPQAVGMSNPGAASSKPSN